MRCTVVLEFEGDGDRQHTQHRLIICPGTASRCGRCLGSALLGLHAIHGADREIRVGMGATCAHFGSDPSGYIECSMRISPR
jgi:hypothetical protein